MEKKFLNSCQIRWDNSDKDNGDVFCDERRSI